MPLEIPLYRGESPRVPSQQFAQPVQLQHIQSYGKQIDAAINSGLKAIEDYAELKDFGTRQEVEAKQAQLAIERDSEFQRRCALANGAEGSFYNADGSRNDDAIANFISTYQEKDAEIDRSFLLRRSAMRDQAESAASQQQIAYKVSLQTAQEESRRRNQAFDTNFALAFEKKDYPAAKAIAEDAHASGLKSLAELNLIKARIDRAQLKDVSDSYAGALDSTPVNIGGKDYSGFSATLAATQQRNAPKTAQNAPQQPQQPAPAATTAGEQQPPQEQPQERFDAARPLTFGPEADFSSFLEATGNSTNLITTSNDDGSTVVKCAAIAPEAVQRVAAHANAHGGIAPEQAEMLVSRITLDMITDNPRLTDAQALETFDKAGIYEALGNGDAAAGKERTRAIVSECIARGTGDLNKLSMQAIQPMIKAHLNSPEFAATREWGMVRDFKLSDEPSKLAGAILNTIPVFAFVSSNQPEAPSDNQQKLSNLYSIYLKYSTEYTPEKSIEMDDFDADKAQKFREWYMKEKYSDIRRIDSDAAADWYNIRIVSDLRDKAYSAADGSVAYQGYAYDVSLARESLRSAPPQNLGADELVAESIRQQEIHAKNAQEFRRIAQADYEKLHALKQSHETNSSKARREAERLEKAEERKAAQRLYVERSKPRNSTWAWDGQNSPDTSLPSCLIPQSEYDHLVNNLGADGSQNIYVQINGARLLVTGVSDKNTFELNSSAVRKVQKKPNLKKGERWQTSGPLGFHYHFDSKYAK
jgi:hypothetical protein